MAVATKQARRRSGRRARTDDVRVGRDTFHVLSPRGAELKVSPVVGAALAVAQTRAMAFEEPVRLTVERRSLVGPPVTLYAVQRDEDGTVHTTPVSPED